MLSGVCIAVTSSTSLPSRRTAEPPPSRVQYLTEMQKEVMRSAFLLPKNPTPDQEKAIRAFKNAFNDGVKGWNRIAAKATE